MTAFATTFAARATAFVFAVATSAAVLGSTVAGMSPAVGTDLQVVALDRVTVTATKLN